MTDVLLQNPTEVEAQNDLSHRESDVDKSNIRQSQVVDQAQEEETISKPQIKDSPTQKNYNPIEIAEDLHNLHSKVDKVLKRSIILENVSSAKSSSALSKSAHSQSSTAIHRINEILTYGHHSYRKTNLNDFDLSNSHATANTYRLNTASSDVRKIHHLEEVNERKYPTSLKSSTYVVQTTHSNELSPSYDQVKLDQIMSRITSSPNLIQTVASPLSAKYTNTRKYVQEPTIQTSHQNRLAQISECLARSPLKHSIDRPSAQQIKLVKPEVEIRPIRSLKVETEAVGNQPKEASTEVKQNSCCGKVENDTESMIIDQVNEAPLVEESEVSAEKNTKEQAEEERPKEKKLTKRQEILNAKKSLKGSGQEVKTPELKNSKTEDVKKNKSEEMESEKLQRKNPSKVELVQSPTKFSASHERQFGNQKARGGN